MTESYLPVSIWSLPGENFIRLHHEAVVRSGERSEGWVVREFDGEFRLVQLRRYATEEAAVEWIESVGGLVMES